MDIRISPDVILARERGRPRRGIFVFLALAVAALTVLLLINPATTQEYEPVCGLEEHEHSEACTETVQKLICPLEETEGHIHGEACYAVQSVLVCTIPEGTVHEHTEDCIVWEENLICGLADDPEHVHTDECFEKTAVYICGQEAGEHLHTEACYEEQNVLVCAIPEGMVHEHTEDCISWEETYVCGLEHDPEHVHSDECIARTPVFTCTQENGVGHVHNDLCYEEQTVYTCGLTAHVHTDECFPKLTGDPHKDVEMDLDWESSFCNVALTGNWAEDLVAIARSQTGYTESELNFVTDEYNVRHGYTRYGDWNGTRYAGWNGLYVMFCLHYAGVWNLPTDPVPANWMNAAQAQGFMKYELPLPGDLVFFDDNADGLADRVAIVTEVREDGFDMIWGGTGRAVEEETVSFDSDTLAGYLALPQNPDYVTLEAKAADIPAEGAVPEEQTAMPPDPYAPVTLTAETEDGVKATLNTIAAVLPYPAEELTLMVRNAEEAADLTGIVESDGAKVVNVRWLEVSIWHEEPVLAENGEAESRTDETEPDADPGWTDSVPPASDALPEETELTDDTQKEPEENEFAANTPAAPDTVSSENELTFETWGAEEPGPEPVPEDSERPADTRLVRVEPSGPVEITVEGLSEDGSIWVYQMTDDGAFEKSSTEQPEGARGSVSFTTGLN